MPAAIDQNMRKQDKITATFHGRRKGALGITYRHTVYIFGDEANVTGDWRKDYGTPELLSLYDTYEHITPTSDYRGTGDANPILTKGHW